MLLHIQVLFQGVGYIDRLEQDPRKPAVLAVADLHGDGIVPGDSIVDTFEKIAGSQRARAAGNVNLHIRRDDENPDRGIEDGRRGDRRTGVRGWRFAPAPRPGGHRPRKRRAVQRSEARNRHGPPVSCARLRSRERGTAMIPYQMELQRLIKRRR